MSNKYTAERAKFSFAQEMQPCPTCGSWHIKVQTPIKMDSLVETDTAKDILSKWGRAVQRGAIMEGPVFIMCFNCGHKGPSVDCTGRSRDDVGQDRALYSEVKRLWNARPHPAQVAERKTP